MASTAAAPERNVVSRACNVEDIFNDFEARRAGILKALTEDVAKLHMECDPDRTNLRLYGLPNRSWELRVPEEEYDPELLLFDIPEPMLGINFARPDNMQDTPWMALVAIHSDSWLLAVAFYYAGRSGFDLDDRTRLFNMINDVPVEHNDLEDVGPPQNISHALKSQAETANRPKRSQKAPSYLKDYEV
ncbi:PHD finger protein Alfin1 [Heracleum sosnowskyi]|uniref:PHD finger protein ALFIN-LIKE n=1 Tax=Heracleum sosnowskyi TaxID=360622 RepID=A0AAD8M6U0_9APIA|nr:PHD finger protein Alfin1 [Heracleum sosnowskyi]